jgi:2-phospho-L-lactate transferase/gluconeogenesis factor (CofD/UPF0052 family)
MPRAASPVEISQRLEYGKQVLQRSIANPTQGPRIVIISGGNATRPLAQHLKEADDNIFYIIGGMFDNGYSTYHIREFIDIPAIGDLRSRLNDLAQQLTLGQKLIFNLIHYRLPDVAGREHLIQEEFDTILSGSHPLIQKIKQNRADRDSINFADLITGDLKIFQNYRKEMIESGQRETDFHLGGASIGNLFLAGAYLRANKNLEAAIYQFASLARVKQHVIPVTTANVHLAARMENGDSVYGQSAITEYEGSHPDSMWLTSKADPTGLHMGATATESALEAIRDAQVLVFSMGSPLTSTGCSFLATGISEAVRQSNAAKVLITNPSQDPETMGLSVGRTYQMMVRLARANDTFTNARPEEYFNNVISNQLKPGIREIDGIDLLPDDTAGIPDSANVFSLDLADGTIYEGRRAKMLTYDPKIIANLIFSFA